jgi:hypothetical protein
MVSGFFKGIGYFIIGAGAIITFLSLNIMWAQEIVPTFFASFVINSIVFFYFLIAGMICLAIGYALDYLKRSAEASEKLLTYSKWKSDESAS